MNGGAGTMRTFRLTLAYDGTGLVGWQRQPTGTSVQGLLEDALATLDGRVVPVAGAGRTDAGVHALGQVASLTMLRDIDAATLRRALNFHLPPPVRVLDVAPVDASFHARFNARSKTYRYQVWNGHVVPPMLRSYVWHVAAPDLDLEVMQRGARALEGLHDFAAFQSVGSDVLTTERRVLSSRVHLADMSGSGGMAGLDSSAGRLVCYEVTADGFLRHMVRSMAGTLVEIGQRRYPPDRLTAILESKQRPQAGRTAPAHGLVLVKVMF
jgi:tRNA pseudouridine38-40 synthase